MNNLMNKAIQAKKVTDQTTKPFLNKPDESIVKALAIANQSI